MSSSASQHISSPSTPFEVGNLSPLQVQVVAALADGRSVTRAAAAAGIHRTTIHKWIRTSAEFRKAVDEARDYFYSQINDQLNELSTVSLDTLRQLLTGPDTPPSVRLQAALAVLERPGLRQPGWQVPEPPIGRILGRFPEPEDCEPDPLDLEMPPASEPRAPSISTSTPRNEPCPCGSGLKYKRCHGSPAGPPLADLVMPLRHSPTPDAA